MRPGRQSVRSIETVVRLREVEERRALEELVHGRASVESSESRLEDLRARMRGAGEAGEKDASDPLRERLFVEILRGCAHRIAKELREDQREFRQLQSNYEKARSRRRLLEELRDQTERRFVREESPEPRGRSVDRLPRDA